jgi:uncharacterized protein (TIGR00290 family)
MGARPKALMAWSSGKDSAWALHVLRERADHEIVGLLTTVSRAHDRVAMHGVRVELLRNQAQAVGLPVRIVPIPSPCSNTEYEAAMGVAIADARLDGVSAIAFGDLFLADVRAYRERQLQGSGISPLFPIWGIPTDVLARRMVDVGLRARLSCVDKSKLSPQFAGRAFDEALLADLPATVDPCGENGEFHSFAHAGPMFRHEVAIEAGEVVERDGFVFADFLPARVSARALRRPSRR